MNYTSIHKQISGLQREIKKEQGFFDGRYITRAVKSKKVFSRTIKHKKDEKRTN